MEVVSSYKLLKIISLLIHVVRRELSAEIYQLVVVVVFVDRNVREPL